MRRPDAGTADGASIGRRLAKAIVPFVVAGYGAFALGSAIDRADVARPVPALILPAIMGSQTVVAGGREALRDGDSSAALEAARTAVDAAPLDRKAVSLLGSARLLEGDQAGADAAFRVSAALGWRDAMTQVYWLDRSLAASDPALAVLRADALLRHDPGFDKAAAILAPFERDGQGRALLAQRLALAPAWRDSYLTAPGLPRETLAARAAVLNDPALRRHPLGCQAIARFAYGLLEYELVDEADNVRRAHCPGSGSLRTLRDADFTGLSRTGGHDPLGWQPLQAGDVSVRVEPSANGNALVLSSDATIARPVVTQSVWLSPGQLQIDWTVLTGDAHRLSISIDCGERRPPRFAGRSSLTVTVRDCPRHTLALWLAPRTGPVTITGLSLAN